jgi:hypothetical protein
MYMSFLPYGFVVLFLLVGPDLLFLLLTQLTSYALFVWLWYVAPRLNFISLLMLF